jgi:superfamily II DNA/RNA helicase
MKYCPDDVQTLMFSATMGKDLDRLAHVTTRKPIRLSADPDNVLFLLFYRKLLRNCINKS